jgi:hypothetical protein
MSCLAQTWHGPALPHISNGVSAAKQTEISQLQFSVRADEEVLGLKVAVQNLAGVAELETTQELEEEELDVAGLDQPAIVHVHLEILVLAAYQNGW